MHAEARDWVRRWAPASVSDIIDVGGRDVNGTITDLFNPDCQWEVIDLYPAHNVTWVGDFADYSGPAIFNVGLYLEVAEHTPDWVDHLHRIRRCLLDNHTSLFIFTAAGPGRAPHSYNGDIVVPDGQHYANIDPGELAEVLGGLYGMYDINVLGDDVRAVAVP